MYEGRGCAQLQGGSYDRARSCDVPRRINGHSQLALSLPSHRLATLVERHHIRSCLNLPSLAGGSRTALVGVILGQIATAKSKADARVEVANSVAVAVRRVCFIHAVAVGQREVVLPPQKPRR